jgi:hypothetical protein
MGITLTWQYLNRGALAERTSYVVNDDAARRFLATLEEPHPDAELGLRRLIDKPNILPDR